MNPTHLRLGNIIDMKFYGEENHWDWSYVKITDLRAMNKFPDIYRPTPLTEEWLINFGFETDGITMWNNHMCVGLFKDNKIKYLKRLNLLGETVELSYVHQLQNLYFALTGEELCLSQKNH